MTAPLTLPEQATRQPRAITTTYVYPPIPERCFDWMAQFDDEDGSEDCYGAHRLQGFGATKQAAIDDLLQQEEDSE